MANHNEEESKLSKQVAKQLAAWDFFVPLEVIEGEWDGATQEQRDEWLGKADIIIRTVLDGLNITIYDAAGELAQLALKLKAQAEHGVIDDCENFIEPDDCAIEWEDLGVDPSDVLCDESCQCYSRSKTLDMGEPTGTDLA